MLKLVKLADAAVRAESLSQCNVTSLMQVLMMRRAA